MHFFMRLIPPRTTFVMDMTPEERRLMEAHAAAPFGIALFDVATESDARAIMDADPTMVAKLNRYELEPMRIAGARAPI